MRFKQTLPAVLAMGCAFTIVFQALYHMAIVSGVFPVSGQPLPLISKGGVSVIATSIAFGIMAEFLDYYREYIVGVGQRQACVLAGAPYAHAGEAAVKADERHERDLLPDNAISDNAVMITPDSPAKQ